MPKSQISIITGQRIRAYRKQQGLNQEELARLADVHPTYIGQLERGEKNATLDTVGKIADALSISLEELFRFTEPPSIHKDRDDLTKLMKLLHTIADQDRETLVKIINVLLEWKKRIGK